jgi:5-methylcytosine-specific restriction endonuclease McrA
MKKLRSNPYDLVGKRFNHVVIIKYVGLINDIHSYRYQCDCGKKRTTNKYGIQRLFSCGCKRHEERKNQSYKYIGKKFNKLTILNVKGYSPNHKALGDVECECGVKVEAIIANVVSGRTKSCGCMKGYHDQPEKSGYNQLRGSYIRSAEVRGIDFLLTNDEFKYLTKQDCSYCGLPPSSKSARFRGWGEYIYNGVDRVDNNKPYIMSNCVPCCGSCNISKGKKTTEEYFKHIQRTYEFLKNKGKI